MLRETMLRVLRRAYRDPLKRPLVRILRRSPLSLSLLAFITALLLIAQPLVAQDLRVGDAWQQVYQLLPDFPRENQYINRGTGKVAESNTLISRLIRYHVYVKIRPVNYRLDWKLTLADYLGANERIPAETYPSADTLRTNPFQNDVAVIRSLNRTQRDALVQTLVNVFTARNDASTPSATPTPQPPNVIPATPIAPSVAPQVKPQREPRPGDAQLLLP
jgi:hypothetical protein